MMSSSPSMEVNSTETSVQTDLTISSQGISDMSSFMTERNIEENLSSKHKLQRLVEKLQLELQAKKSQLEAVDSKAESIAAHFSLQKDGIVSEKQGIINRLENELQSTKEELTMIKNRTARELAHLMEKCVTFQETQKLLQYQQDDVKTALEDLLITEENYNTLKLTPMDQLNLKDFASLRLHESVVPLQHKIKELLDVNSSLRSRISAYETQFTTKNQTNQEQSDIIMNLTQKVNDLNKQLESLKSDLREEDFRVINFDRIRRERDKFENENKELTSKNSELELLSTTFRKDRDTLESRLNETYGKLRRLEQDQFEYKHSNIELNKMISLTKEDLSRTSALLNAERSKYEQIHTKYMDTRQQYVSVSDELNEITMKYKNLNEQYKKMANSESELQEKLYKVSRLYDECSHSKQTETLKLTNEKNLISIELDELKRLFNTSNRSYQLKLEECASLQKNINKVTSTAQKEKLELQARISTLQKQFDELNRQLEDYKSIEKEYKNTVIATANLENHTMEAVPIVANKSLPSEVLSLTRRVLVLEKENLQACLTIQKLTLSLDQLKTNLISYKTAVGLAGQPVSELLERISSQQTQITSFESALKASDDTRHILEHDLSESKKKIESLLLEFSRRDRTNYELSLLKSELTKLSSKIESSSNRNQILPKAIRISKDVNL